ncbi:MAG: hypothetical protein N2510_03580 [Ignavibacteria bacterium]|nr:hypothetical protein [Ignavibacteria bacterium]
MKNKINIPAVMFLLFFSECLHSQNEEPVVADTVKIGAYIFSVYDLDFPGNKINVDYYVWYVARADSMELLQYFEPVNAVEYTKSNESDEVKGELIYQTMRINSKIKKEWDVSNFPFDRQTIEILIEDYDKDISKLVFIADTSASKIDKDVKLEGWNITDFGIRVVDHTYETNYGDPELSLEDYSTYSRAILHFTIERKGYGLFFKLFIGLFISVLISLVTFFINPLDLDPRFGLSVGAIFAAIASQYVIASTLPQSATLTLVDKLHDVAYIFIFICISVSALSLHYMKNGKEKSSEKLDRYSFYILSASYVIITLYFILTAI